MKKNIIKNNNFGGKVSSFMKDSIALICAAGIGAGAAVGTTTAIDAGISAYEKYNETEMVKKHFWSRPVEVYVRNGKPVVRR